MGLFSKIKKHMWMVRAFLPSLVFCLKHLPLSQAVKLPILLYKPSLGDNTGKFIINTPVRFGMIRLGTRIVGIYPNSGIILDNRGTILFNGSCTIGNDSAISIGNTGTLELGNRFAATCGLKLACYHSVRCEDNVLIGWNTLISDTDFHSLININGGATKGFGPIKIEHDVWIGNGCKIYKNSRIPHSCVVGADTILHKPVDCKPYSLIINKTDISVRTTGYFHDCDKDKIYYTNYES